LLISGDADLYMPHAAALKMAHRVPRAELVLVENASHAVFWERPEEFNRAVLDFLARRGRESTTRR
jgi:pimeloyl-ACP methyl ester carboxylesterase